MSVQFLSFQTQDQQYHWITQELAKPNQNSTAVIGRSHKDLQNLIPFLNQANIIFSYEKGQNPLQNLLVQELLTLLKFVNSLLKSNQSIANYLLPQVLCFDFWNLPKQQVFDLALNAQRKKTIDWLAQVLSSENQELKDFGNFCLNLAEAAKQEPVQNLLEYLLGLQDLQGFQSPFLQFYFLGKQVDSEYMRLLSDLQSLLQNFQNYRPKASIFLADLVIFIELLESNQIEIINAESNNFLPKNAVQLLTAHKSKGMEFEKVFVINCSQNSWQKKGKSELLSFPQNLPFAPEKDNKNDNLRLFFVACTRAKTDLIMTNFETDNLQKVQHPLEFIDSPVQKMPKQETAEILEDLEAKLFFKTKTLSVKNQDFLEQTLQNYQLSATHLINFLDVSNGGPKHFLEQNLLNFPQPKIPAAMFGTAMHQSLAWFFNFFKQRQNPANLSDLQIEFEKFLLRQSLKNSDQKMFLEKGRDSLAGIYSNLLQKLQSQMWVEKDFKKLGINFAGANLTGKMDLIELKDDCLTVTDFKTGKSLKRLENPLKSEEYKAWKYGLQLCFYRLLLRESRQFANFDEVKLKLEYIEKRENQKQVPVEIFKIIGDEEMQRLEKLVEIVYQKIIKQEFVDTAEFNLDLQGIKEFEEVLLG